MKRANGEGTISKCSSDGRWIGQITLGFDNNGKAIRKACSAKTQSECRKKLDLLKTQFALVKSSNISAAQKPYPDYLLTDWINEKKNVEQLEESTIQPHIGRINCYFKEFFKNIELQKIDSKIVSDFYAHLSSNNLSAETIRKIHAIVNNSFKLAVRNGLVTSNPAQGIKLPKVRQKEKIALSDSEVNKILQAAKLFTETSQNKNIYPLVMLALVTGLRRGELAALTWENIDFANKKVIVRHSLAEIKGKGTVLKSTKTEASKRSVSVPSSMIDILKSHKENYAIGTFVFPCCTDKNTPQTPRNICRTYKKVLKMAEIESSLHILRHTNITNLITNGTDIKTVKNRAGHTRIETTMSYTHPSEELDKKSADIFEKFL